MAEMEDEDTVNKTFADLGLNEWLINQCKAVGLLKPTPIQNNCVPEILKGEWTLYCNFNMLIFLCMFFER